MDGIVCTDFDSALKIAYAIEKTFPNASYMQNEGEGVHEDRPEYLIIYNHCELKRHPDGAQTAVILDTPARGMMTELKSTLAELRSSGAATAENIALDDSMIPETTLGDDWTPTDLDPGLN